MTEKIILTTYLALTFVACSQIQKEGDLNRITISWVGSESLNFSNDLSVAKSKLLDFAKIHGWQSYVNDELIKEVKHFETKQAFDAELLHLSDGKMKEVPRTYVALMDEKVLRIVSWEAYKIIHPNHKKIDYMKVIRHEMAHQLHADLVGNDGMGPAWFFEGFAVVAADQYIDQIQLSKSEITEVIKSKDRGDYKKFGFVLRELSKKTLLKNLVQKAASLSKEEFISFLKN